MPFQDGSIAVSGPESCGGHGPTEDLHRSAGTPDTGAATLEDASFVLGRSTPHSVVLAGVESPFQTGRSYLTAMADGLCLFRLQKRLAGVPVREEQLGILVHAGSAVEPSQRRRTPLIQVLGDLHHVSRLRKQP